MNIQREAIYKKRSNALSGERLSVDLNNMFRSIAESSILTHKGQGSYEMFQRDTISILGIDPGISEKEFNDLNENELMDLFFERFVAFYQSKFNQISAMLLPQIQQVHTHSPQYKRILIPFTDGRQNPLPVSAGIEEAVKTKGKSIARDIEQAVTLAIIDDNWKEHLRSMDELKDSAQSASFEQKDPLVVYKMEAYNLFEKLVNEINLDATAYLAKGTLMFAPNNGGLQQAREQKTDFSKVGTNKVGESEGVQTAVKTQTSVRTEKKVGRNDLCPCGSGKKYKHCHGN